LNEIGPPEVLESGDGLEYNEVSMWNSKPRPQAKQSERRKRERRAFPHYMRLMNEHTGELIGHMVDISTEGFRLESLKPIRPNTEFPMRIEVPPDVAPRPFLVFIARSRWSLPDRIDPMLYDAGFQITDIAPGDNQVFGQLFEKYGSLYAREDANKHDYLWR
jgi:hypothetical protein